MRAPAQVNCRLEESVAGDRCVEILCRLPVRDVHEPELAVVQRLVQATGAVESLGSAVPPSLTA